LLKVYGGENLTVTIVDPEGKKEPLDCLINQLYPYPIARSKAMPEEIQYLSINNDEMTILHHPLLDPPDAAEPSTVRRALGLWMQEHNNCDGIRTLDGLPLSEFSGADFQALKRMCPPDATIHGITVAELTKHLYASDHGPNHDRPVSDAWGHTLPAGTESWVEKAENLLKQVMKVIIENDSKNNTKKASHLRLAVVTDGKEYVIVSNDPASLPWGYWTCAEHSALELSASRRPDTVIERLVLVHSVHDENGEGMIGPQACPCGSCAEAIGHRLLTVVGTDLKEGRQVFSNHDDPTLTLVPGNIPSRPLARQSITIHLENGTTVESYGLSTEHVDCSHPPQVHLAVELPKWFSGYDNVFVSSRLAPWLGVVVPAITMITINTECPSILTLEAARRQNPEGSPIPIQTITGTQLEPPTQWALAMIQQRPNHR
jgi:cytidine deaminase